MWRAIGWLCQLVATPCPPTPDVAAIQTAYEQEETAGGALHDKGLKVLWTKCHDDIADRFLCEVTFISRDDPTERLYFDIIAVARDGNGWRLKSGLCKR